jgi:ADP-heptose:LPS heptosyltransferase
MVTFDPVCYSVNSTAMGDVLAAVPVVKYAIETYHKDCDYRVVASSHFRCFFHFVPDSKFLATNDDTWKFDKKYAIRRLNDIDAKTGHLCRLTPAKMMLSHYAAIGLAGEILPRSAYAYVPLPEVDVSKFGVDFTKAVVLVVSYRDLNRSIPSEELVKIAAYVQSRGYIPVYIGRTVDGAWKERPPVSPFVPPAFGVDLRNKTTIPELATIMAKSIAVCGVDSGPVTLTWIGVIEFPLDFRDEL